MMSFIQYSLTATVSKYLPQYDPDGVNKIKGICIIISSRKWVLCEIDYQILTSSMRKTFNEIHKECLPRYIYFGIKS